MRKFFEKYENFNEYDYPFGEDFLKSLFNEQYKRKYSLIGDGIYNIVFKDNKIYSIDLKQGKNLLLNDGKKAFRDSTKDEIIDIITKELNKNNIIFTINSGKFVTFEYNNFIFKIEVVKKAAMPK